MSSGSDLGSVPAGLNLSESKDVLLYVSVIPLGILATIAVMFRAWSRLLERGAQITADDWLVFAALVFGWATAICCLIGLRFGGGRHLWADTDDQLIELWKILFSFTVIYGIAVTLTKLSIIFFYRRIFFLGYPIWIAGFLAASWGLCVILVTLNLCDPIEEFWMTPVGTDLQLNCLNIIDFWEASGVIGIAIDMLILCTPIPAILKLRASKKQKLFIFGILILGGFACVASVIRLVNVNVLIHTKDLTWSLTDLFIWSCCEVFMGIICACLATFAPLIRHCWISLRAQIPWLGCVLRRTEDTDEHQWHAGTSLPTWKSSKEDRCLNLELGAKVNYSNKDKEEFGIVVPGPSSGNVGDEPSENIDEVALEKQAT